jgi:transposase
MRKKHSVEFKAKVAVEAIRQLKTINELTTEYGIHATQINAWKKQALAAIPAAFSGNKGPADDHQPAEIDELHRQIGQLIAERDWLKKKSSAFPPRPGKP